MNYLPGDNIMTKLKQNTSQLQVLVWDPSQNGALEHQHRHRGVRFTDLELGHRQLQLFLAHRRWACPASIRRSCDSGRLNVRDWWVRQHYLQLCSKRWSVQFLLVCYSKYKHPDYLEPNRDVTNAILATRIRVFGDNWRGCWLYLLCWWLPECEESWRSRQYGHGISNYRQQVGRTTWGRQHVDGSRNRAVFHWCWYDRHRFWSGGRVYHGRHTQEHAPEHQRL